MTSKLILGTVQFGLAYGINNNSGKVSSQEVTSILNYAHDSGVNYLDTAPVYGNAERYIGNYLNLFKGRDFKIITKFRSPAGASLIKSVVESLEHLGVTILDTVLFHSFNDYLAAKSDLSEFINNYKNKYFRKIGVSVYTNDEIMAIADDPHIDVVQAPFNLLDNSNARKDAFLLLKENKKTIHVRSVFLQGLFFKDPDAVPVSLMNLKDYIIRLNELSEKSDIPMHSLALNYVMTRPYIDGVLVGVDSCEHLKNNLDILNTSLPDSVVSEIESIKFPHSQLLNPSIWKVLK